MVFPDFRAHFGHKLGCGQDREESERKLHEVISHCRENYLCLVSNCQLANKLPEHFNWRKSQSVG